MMRIPGGTLVSVKELLRSSLSGSRSLSDHILGQIVELGAPEFVERNMEGPLDIEESPKMLEARALRG